MTEKFRATSAAGIPTVRASIRPKTSFESALKPGDGRSHDFSGEWPQTSMK